MMKRAKLNTDNLRPVSPFNKTNPGSAPATVAAPSLSPKRIGVTGSPLERSALKEKLFASAARRPVHFQNCQSRNQLARGQACKGILIFFFFFFSSTNEIISCSARIKSLRISSRVACYLTAFRWLRDVSVCILEWKVDAVNETAVREQHRRARPWWALGDDALSSSADGRRTT